MAARFYAESLGITLDQGEAVARFMALAQKSKACISPAPWAKHGKARVYFEIWSQNSLSAIECIEAAYFDAGIGDIFVQQYMYGSRVARPLSEIVSGKKDIFSGSKTKAALVEMAEAFYGQSSDWD